MSNSETEEDYHLPLQDQRVFGAGIKRKRVPFVPASSLSTVTAKVDSKPVQQTAQSRYLSIVLPGDSDDKSSDKQPPEFFAKSHICPICSLPISTSPFTPHETSLAHQACLPHSHPPSHLDREHVGLKYLSSYGWDPDSRVGLGAAGEGIRVPIKGKVKNDTIGLGISPASKDAVTKKAEKERKLNAKEVRKRAAEERQRGEKLREMFYSNPDIERYLGPGG